MSGDVTDMRHVVEQVGLARKILVGEEDGIGGTGSGGEVSGGTVINDEASTSGGGGGFLSGQWIGKLGKSGSVTSLATLSNLVG